MTILNDSEREEWVRNNESLHNWWRGEMGGEKKLRQFVRANRDALDRAIEKLRKPQQAEDKPYYMMGRGAVGPMTSPRR